MNILTKIDDPPFHLPQQTTADSASRELPVRTTSDMDAFNLSSYNKQSLSSSSGEFRSVIDDLTVENKKLRQKLKLYERSHAAHLHPDRMFEVRMPGLMGKDKTRLERLLKNFADSISGSENGHSKTVSKAKSKLGSKNPSSAHSGQLVDSAYASGSGSAGNVTGTQPPLGSRTNASDSTSHGESSGQGSKNTRVRSYLQDMGQGLLPKRPLAMTEKGRQKEVIKRLEHLFTGKARTKAKSSQSAQQQEVSNAAAKADKKAKGSKGNDEEPEGTREAHILQADAEAALLRSDSTGKIKEKESPDGEIDEISPDQRPTKPLDLDLNRAQNAAENLAYIRHLGFHPREATDEQQDADGWVWLNLLTSMAQLHTINVTPEFVRRAVKEMSHKLELSPDGSKIRWLGGAENTVMSGDSGSSSDSKSESPEVSMQDQPPSRSRSSKPSASDRLPGILKSCETGTDSGANSSSRDLSTSTDEMRKIGRRPIFLGQMTKQNSFQYSPMFLHGASSGDEGDYYLGDSDSLNSSGLQEDFTGGGGSSYWAGRDVPARPGFEDGPMIFYHRARFVTDLSGDQGFTAMSNVSYAVTSKEVLGAKPVVDRSSAVEAKGLLSSSIAEDPTASELQEEDDVSLPEFVGKASRTPLRNGEPLPLPVSGLGGVIPAENLVFYPRHLQTSHDRNQALSAADDRYRKYAKHAREKLFGNDSSLLNRISSQDRLEVRLEGAGRVEHAELQPSELPPPSYAHVFRSSSAEDDGWDSDVESEGEDDELLRGSEDIRLMPDFVPPAMMLTHQETSGYEDSEEESETEGEVEVDMLAHERELNAEDVAERERLWEEGNRSPSPAASPASSHATVGDRSFLSDEEDGPRTPERQQRGQSLHAGSKRGLEDIGGVQTMGSPAKRVETPRTRDGRK